MNKLSIFLCCTLIACSAQAMDYEVVSTVERKEFLDREVGSCDVKRLITFAGFVKKSKTNELFKATIQCKYNPAFANPVVHTGEFLGVITPVLENQTLGNMQDLEFDDITTLFSKLSAAYISAELAEITKDKDHQDFLEAQERDIRLKVTKTLRAREKK